MSIFILIVENSNFSEVTGSLWFYFKHGSLWFYSKCSFKNYVVLGSSPVAVSDAFVSSKYKAKLLEDSF